MVNCYVSVASIDPTNVFVWFKIVDERLLLLLPFKRKRFLNEGADFRDCLRIDQSEGGQVGGCSPLDSIIDFLARIRSRSNK